MTDAAREARIEELVRFLCSPTCAGRLPGSPEGIAARRRIVAEMEAAGLDPLGEDGFLQHVPDCGANVLGEIPGQGPHADRSILVAAHYDHLGHDANGEVYWGADDNAAAVAILMEVARDLSRDRNRLGRKIIIAAFDGEEPPHFLENTMGSMHYVRESPEPIGRIDLMVCMDLVGHAIGPEGFPDDVRNSLFVLGAELSERTAELVDDVEIFVDGNAFDTFVSDGAVVFNALQSENIRLGPGTEFRMDEFRIYDTVFEPQGQCTEIIGGTWDGSGCSLP